MCREDETAAAFCIGFMIEPTSFKADQKPIVCVISHPNTKP